MIELEKKYIKAAKNAQLAGCDGVEVHCISYIIGQLATKSINLRTDEYGGSLENRLRFPLNVIRGIRKECGPDFIIGARIPVHKWETDGFTYEESAKLAKAYEEAGCDFLDANGGLPPRISCLMETSRYEQGYRVDLAAFIKKVVNIPVFTVGNLREPDFCEQVLANGKSDYIMLGRALIADPEWPNKAAAGKADEIRPCISCLHACFGNLAKHQSIQCVLNPEVSYESILQTVKPPEKAKRIIIIGGGIAGMQAAITAHDRGHSVTLLEKEEQLGGQLKVASAAPHKQNISKVKDWFVKQVEKRNIDVRFRFNGSVRVIQVMNPDLVLVATGSVPCKPDIPGIKKAIQAWDVLLGKAKLPEGQKVAILGGGTVGCEVAELLAEKGHQVTVFEMTDQIARGLEGANTLDLLEVIEKLKIDIRLNSKVTEIDENKVCYEENGTAKSEEFQQIILALGQKSNCDNIINGLESAGIEYKIIGDALKPSNFHNATSTAYFAALDA